MAKKIKDSDSNNSWSLEKRINELEYTSLQTYRKMDSLAGEIIDILGNKIRSVNDDYRQGLLTVAGFAPNMFGIDPYVYSAGTMLNTVLLTTSSRYKRNGIDIGKEFISDNKLKSILPRLFLDSIKEDGLDPEEMNNMLKLATNSFIEGIETEFSTIPDYDKQYASKELTSVIKQRLGNIKKYAGLCYRCGDIISDLGMITIGGAVKEGMRRLNNPNKLMKEIKDDCSYKILDNVLQVHAAVHSLPYLQQPTSFYERCGEEITFALRMAKAAHEQMNLSMNCKCAGRNKFVAQGFDKNLYFVTDREELNEHFNKDIVSFTGLSAISDGWLEQYLEYVRSPFADLEEQLQAFGVPREFAIGLKDFLSVNVLTRGISDLVPEPEMSDNPDSAWAILAKQENDDNYIDALKSIMKRITGAAIPKIYYSYCNSPEKTGLSNGIANSVDVTKTSKNKEMKLIYNGSLRDDVRGSLENILDIFNQEEYEVYIGDNVGVCFMYEGDIAQLPKSLDTTTIEARNIFRAIPGVNKTLANIYKTAIDFHEVTHATQINSRLAWRNVCSYMLQAIADSAITDYSKNRLDCEYPDSTSIFEGKEDVKTHRDEILKTLDLTIAQALGTGKLANSIRKMGLYDGLMECGIEIESSGDIDWDYITEIKLEESKTSQLAVKIREAIEKDDIDGLKKLKGKAEDLHEDYGVLLETMAEAYSIIATEEFVKNYPDKRYSESTKQKYAGLLRQRLLYQGSRAEAAMNIFAEQDSLKDVELRNRLKKHGLKYKRVINNDVDTAPVDRNLIQLGYNPIMPFEAYHNMFELEMRIKEYNKSTKSHKNKLTVEKCLYPINKARAGIDIKYRANIGLFLDVIDYLGTQKAHKFLLNCESLSDVMKYKRRR